MQVLEWEDGYNTHRSSITKHFSMILDTLEQTYPDALVLLRFYSFLEPEAIPLFDNWYRSEQEPGLVDSHRYKASTRWQNCSHFMCCFCSRHTAYETPSDDTTTRSILEDIFQDECRREKAIAKLWDLSLVRRIRDNKRFQWMHDSTKKAVRALIPNDDVVIWVKEGLKAIYHMFPLEDTTATDREWVDLCLPQAMAIIHQAKSIGLPTNQYACLLVLCAQSNVSHGAVVKGLEQYEQARPEYEKSLGIDNPRTINLLYRISWANKFLGNMDEATHLARRTLMLREKVLGPESQETLEAMNNLAVVIERAGKLQEAENMFKSIYKRNQKVSGPTDANTLAAAHNLALCYANKGRLFDAEKMYKIALEPSEKHLGLDDVGTLKTLGNLAATVDHQGRLEEAQLLYEKALPLFIKVMGFDHFLTLRLRSNIAGLRRQQGSFEQAEEMIKGCYTAVTKLYGVNNFESLAVLYELGEVLHAKGDLQTAQDTYDQIMGLFSGDMMDHPVALRFVDASGIVVREMGHLESAEKKSHQAYQRFHQLLGWDDPYTLVAANDYAELLHAQGKYDQAHSLYENCRRSMGKLLGKQHPHYLMTTNNLGRLSRVMDIHDPMEFFNEAHEGFSHLLGADHYCTLTVSLNIAQMRFKRGEFEQAVSAVEHIHQTMKVCISDKHPSVLACDLALGMMLASQGDDESLIRAKDHFLSAVEGAMYTGCTKGVDYFIGLSLLVLLLKSVQADDQTIEHFSKEIDRNSDTIRGLSPLNIPTMGRIHIQDFSRLDPKTFDWTTYIPLASAETTRLRWGRKTCWREAERVQIRG